MRGRVLAAVASAVLVAGGASASSVVDGASSTHSRATTRYSLAHGCYALYSRGSRPRPIAKSAGPFRMQPSTLAVYLLYGRHGRYLIDRGKSVEAVSHPSTLAQWRVKGAANHGFTIRNMHTRRKLAVSFVRASNCLVFPEAQVDARGKPFTGPSPGSTVKGTMEGHAHITAFELFGGDWHCGRPWHPLGVPYALPGDCSRKQQGTNGEFEAFLDFGGPNRPSDMHGWPTFRHWPEPTTLAEEGDYYTAVERAWKAGLRVFVTQLVDNEALCDVMTKKRHPCNDMSSVHIQDRDLHNLQTYVDAQSGGPGKGWFRIVHDPFQARRVINQGKLAVVEGVEMSRILGCGEQYGVPQCNQSQIDSGLKEIRRLGIRTFFPVHEFDNAFGGTKMIAGETGMIVNAGNRDKTGSFWSVKSCPASVQDAPQVSGPAAGAAVLNLLNGGFGSLTHGSPLPAYPPPPHCNTRGLTDLGGYLIRKMIQQHFIIQTDHMSSKTADSAVKIAEQHHYSGVVSAHCCNSPQLFHRIYKLGGYVNPPVSPGEGFINRWKADKSVRQRSFTFGFGWGSDMNGLAEQPGPTTPSIKYPFKSFDGRVTFTREQWGQRKFDYNKEGLSNYGLYADWLEQVRMAGGRPVLNDMFRGAEAYLDMWERAFGVPSTHCKAAAHFAAAGLGRLRLGAGRVTTLYRSGQPSARPGRSYRYCVAGHTGRGISAVFNLRGRLAFIASNAGGALADGVGPGGAAGALPVGVTDLGGGVWLGRGLHKGAHYVYVVRSGRVAVAGVAAASEAAHPGRLRADVRSAGL